MPCNPIIDEDGKVIGFACSRGKQKRETCYICGTPSTLLCDICDKPICTVHAKKVAFDTDVCPEHDNETDIKRAIQRRIELG